MPSIVLGCLTDRLFRESTIQAWARVSSGPLGGGLGNVICYSPSEEGNGVNAMLSLEADD
jgi:hypothetical protein